MHGGKAPQNQEAAAQRVTEESLMALAADLVGTPVDNPLLELGKVAGRTRAWMELLEGRVQQLLAEASGAADDDSEDEDDGRGTAGIRYYHRTGEQIRAEVQLYERAMSQLGNLLASIARLNIDERLAAISESQADAVLTALDAGLKAAGVRDPGLLAQARSAAGAHLRRVK